MGYQRTLEQELDDKASLIFLPGDRITSFQSLKSTLLRPSDAHLPSLDIKFPLREAARSL